jgi:hypothetical protein
MEMTKKNLVMVLVSLCLLVTLVFTTGGAAAGVTAATVKVPIIALASPGGAISPNGIVLVNVGGSKSFTIKPASGFHIVDVLVDGASVGRVAKYTFANVPPPEVAPVHRIHALFATNLVINAGAGEGGKIEPDGLVVVNYGKDATFTITPDPGYYIGGVIIDQKRFLPVNSFTFKSVKAAHSILALFNKTFPILATANEGGSIDPEGMQMVNAGENKVFTITPDSGKHIVNVRVDEIWVGALNTYTFNAVAGPHNIIAVFNTTQYPVTTKVGAGGTVSPSGTLMMDLGSSEAFTITPKTGYYILDVVVDGTSIGTIPNPTEAYTYNLNNVMAPHLIVVTFKKGTPPS